MCRAAVRRSLFATVGLLVASVAWGQLRAEPPPPQPFATLSGAPVVVEGPTAPYFPDEQPTLVNPPLPPAAAPAPRNGWLQRHGLGCWTTHNTLGCSSLKSECIFIFGSCRQFFGEPCMAPPPPDPFGPNYGRSGCGCR